MFQSIFASYWTPAMRTIISHPSFHTSTQSVCIPTRLTVWRTNMRTVFAIISFHTSYKNVKIIKQLKLPISLMFKKKHEALNVRAVFKTQTSLTKCIYQWNGHTYFKLTLVMKLYLLHWLQCCPMYPFWHPLRHTPFTW